MLGTELPVGSRMCVFSRVKAVLVAHLDGRLQIIHVCPCGYTVYFNCTSDAFASNKYRNERRTKCPRRKCGLTRYLPDIYPPVPRKVMYYLSVADWVQDCYNRPDLVDFLRNDGTCDTSGSVTRSQGWKDKVIDNPIMQTDVRNLALIGTADSVPYFKDRGARGGVPVMLRIANLPPALQLRLENCHLAGIMPNEVQVVDADTGAIKRVNTKNSTLYPILLVLADELCNLYARGCQTTDATRPAGHADRIFILRCILLYWSAHSACLRFTVATGCDHGCDRFSIVVTGCNRM
jgi:hypothetical protein